MGKRMCPYCQKVEIDENEAMCNYCRNRFKHRTRKYSRSNKLKAIEYLGNRCHSCGESFEIPDVYDFHHLDPATKDSTISSVISSKGIELLKAELDKCILLCANCHRKIHYQMRAEEEIAEIKLINPNTHLWTEQDTIILQNNIGTDIKSLKSLLPRWSEVYLRNKAKELGIEITSYKKRQWAEKEVDELRSMIANDEPVTHLMEYFNRTKDNIINKILEIGLTIPNPKKRISYTPVNMASLNSPWWLGIIWGGATLSKHEQEIKFHFGGSELNLAQYIKEHLCSEAILRITKYNTYELIIRNGEFLDQLLKLGLRYKDKGSINVPPSLEPDQLMPFLQGYFEMKAKIREKRRLEIELYDSLEMLDLFNQEFKKYYEHKTEVRKNKTYYLTYKGKTAIKLLEWLYKENEYKEGKIYYYK